MFELDKAAAYAVRMNKQGRNIYVGVALRQGETGPSGRANKDNVVTASCTWSDFDQEGDGERVAECLQRLGITPMVSVRTGTIPHTRWQVFFRLTGAPSPAELEAVNEALRDHLGGNGDGVQNADRIMRLGGTVSYPPPKKVARGYVPELTQLACYKGHQAYKCDQLIRLLKGELKVTSSGFFKSTSAADGGKEKTFWRKVNEMALANLNLWVSEVFGDDAVFQKGTGAYRVSSKKLNRDLEEDLSLSPKGITDWGLDDQGKPGEKAARHTAIDIVVEHGGAANAKQAALWLCEKCGVDPASLGWKQGGGAGAGNPEIERLAALSQIDYEKERKTAAKKLGFRTKVLDDLVGQLRGEEKQEESGSMIDQINADHALVLAGNKAAIMKFEEGPTKFRLLQTSAFVTWFIDLPWVPFGANGYEISFGEYWLRHPARRKYAGIEFAPPGTAVRPGYYNLWQGFAVERRKGDCSKFPAHIRDNVARGDEATFLWIVGWWAQIFQQPSVKMETALGLRGPQGTGKTKLGEVMGSLIGESHYLPVASPRYITGQFNSHMASLLVLQAEEAFWAGDKKGEGILKDLVSGKSHMLEYKGVDPIKIKNFIRLYVSSNSDWIVPAGFRDRRWAIFDIGEDRMQDNVYFASIDEEMANGGREALLDYLLDFDLSQVNLRKIPKTAALLDQQIESMNPEQAWWFEMLMGGVLPARPSGVKEARVVLKSDLYETYIVHARLQGISHRSIETKIGVFLQKQLGERLTYPRPLIGDGENAKQLKCYKPPPLKECRQLYAEKLGQTVDWGRPDWETEEWQQSQGGWDTFMSLGNSRFF